MDYIFLISAKRKNKPNSETYTLGWRKNAKSVILEKAVTERSVCFEDIMVATAWLSWVRKFLPKYFNYQILGTPKASVEQNMKMWTQPVWSKQIDDVPQHISTLPFFLERK